MRSLLYLVSLLLPLRSDPRELTPRAAMAARPCARDHGSGGDARVPGTDGDTRRRSPGATGTCWNDAERDCQRGCRRTCRSVSFSGIRLSRIPLCQLLPQLRRPMGGSVGVPDSLDAKQVSTSGPAPVPCRLLTASVVLASACWSPPAGAASHCYFLHKAHLDAILFVAGVGVLGCNNNFLTCANAKRIASQVAKFPEINPENYCAHVRDRVTFVVSPGNPETTTHPG